VIENKQGHELEFVEEHRLNVSNVLDTWRCKHCKAFYRTVRSIGPGADREKLTALGLVDIKRYLDVDPCKAPTSATAEAIAAASRPAPLTIEVNMPVGDRAEIGKSINEALVEYYDKTGMSGSWPGVAEQILDEKYADAFCRFVESEIKATMDRLAANDPGDEQPTPRPTFPAWPITTAPALSNLDDDPTDITIPPLPSLLRLRRPHRRDP